MEVNGNKKLIGIIMILLIITMTMAIIGASYSYFRATVEYEDVSSISVTTSTLHITYAETKNIMGSGILPGWTDIKVFSVSNTGTAVVSYNMVWDNVINTLIGKEFLVYSIVGTGKDAFNTASPVIFPSNSSEIIANYITIDPGVTHNYTLTITYIDSPEYDQSDDMNKTFAAKIKIESN